jgi:hypothetical protein
MKLSLLTAAALAALAAAAPAAAQDAAAAGPDDVRVNQLIIYGDEACPPSTEEEIVVCARKPEAERYRIPENLRDDPNDPRRNSWSNRAVELSYVGRTGIGSCSPTGPGGMTGCFNQLVSQARAERAGRDEVNWNRLIDEARQERLSRIDEEAEAVEREQSQPQ